MDLKRRENLCRLCANSGANYQSIFDGNIASIADKINNCLPISISEEDRLPSHICCPCLEALNISDKLRTQSLVADEILRQQLRIIRIEDIKQEKDDDPGHIYNKTERLLCGICRVDFEEECEFDAHMRSAHSSPWECSLCEEHFKNADDLLRHNRQKHYDRDNPMAPDTPGETEQFKPEEDGSNDDYFRVSDSMDLKNETPPSVVPSSTPQLVGNSNGLPRTTTTLSCSICDVSIPTEKLMTIHRKMHEPRQISCHRCFRVFPSPYELFTHKQNAHRVFVDQKMKWFCDKCERFTTSVQFLRRHQDFCTKIKLKCKYCPMSFIKQGDLEFHLKKTHYEAAMKDPESEKYECKTCGKSYVDKAYYTLHVRKHQAKAEGKFTCSVCTKKFPTASVLRGHIEIVHERNRKYVCDICFKGFCGARNLRIHRKRHMSQTCQECGDQFENKMLLTTHLFNKHNISGPSVGKHTCKLCGRSFSKLRLLRDHKNSHTGTKPHTCENCQKTFRTYAARWVHQQRHKHGGLTCDHCKRNFMDKNNLRRHMAQHLRSEEWRCDAKDAT